MESFGLPKVGKTASEKSMDDFADGEIKRAQTEIKQEQWNPEEAMVVYTTRNENVTRKLADVENRINSLFQREGGSGFDETEIDTLITERASIQQEMIAASANYPGDWTNLLYARLDNPATKKKFIERRTEAMPYMKDNLSEVGRRERPKTHYQDQIDSYDASVERVFSKTEIGMASDFSSKGRNLGNMGNEGVGAVFSDAEHHGIPLTNRQKNIIEAHEKGHCLRDFASPYDRQEIQRTIDRARIDELNKLRQANGSERIAPTYVADPMEITERMAQFKNYFGMGAYDKFDKNHLDYIREHYVADTGLDNGVSDLLYVVTPDTESTFLEVMNKYPI